MISLVKMYLYRITKLSMILILMIGLLIVTLMPIARNLIFSTMIEKNTSVWRIILDIISSGILCLICSVMISLLFVNDYSNAFVKNIATKISKKYVILVSRMIVTIIIVMVIYGAVFLYSYLIYGVVLGLDMKYDELNMSKIILSQLLTISYLSLTNMLIVISRTAVLPIAVSIISLTGMLFFFIMILNWIISSLFSIGSFDLSFYFISTIIKNIGMEIDEGKSLVIGVVYFIIPMIYSSVLIDKQDIA